MRFVRTALLMAGIALLPACSEKGPDVEKVKQDVTAELTALAGPEGQKYLGFDGVEAVADGDKAKVTIKGMKFLVAGADAMTIGDVEMHALAKGADQYEISDLKIPSKVTFKGPQGDLAVEIGSQTWSGLWSTKYHNFLSGDGKYTGVKASGPGLEGGTVELSEIAMKVASEDKGNGVFDQTGTGTLKSLTYAGPEGSGVFSSGEFKSEMKGAKLADLQAFGRDWQALIMAMGEGKPADAALVGRLKGYVGALAAVSMHMDLAGAMFKDAAGAELFGAEHMIIDGGGTALDQPKGGFTFDLGLLGLKVPAAAGNPMAAKYAEFIPTIVKFGYALDDLPAKELWSAWLDLIASGAMQPGNEAVAQTAMQGFGMQIMQLANQAGSALRITNIEIESPAARLKMDGTIKADATSPMGMAGSANVEVGGFDAMAAAAKESMPPEDAANASDMFELIRGFSNRETTADNKVIDRYAIELTPTGDVTINNKPFDLLGAVMGTPTQPGVQ